MRDLGYESVDLHGQEVAIPMKPIILCIISSTDRNLIPSEIIVNLHPDTVIARIVQYVYDLVHPRTTHSIHDFALTHNGNLLQLSAPLSSANGDQGSVSHKFLRLNFDLYEYNDVPHNFECDYAIDFMYGDFNIKINLLSSNDDKKNNPIITLSKSRVPLNISGSRLQKLLLEDIKDLEIDKNTLCDFKDGHSIEDFIAFKIKGNDDNRTITLKDKHGKINDNFLDAPLSDILGISFMPEKFTRFTLMFYMHHEYNCSSDEKMLEFISDIPTLYNQMVINDNTTVIDIKRYIIQTCLIHFNYDIPLHDITLLYQGKRVQEDDSVGNVVLIKDIIGDNKNPSIHVQMPSIDIDRLNQVDSFWCRNVRCNKRLSDVSVNSGESDESESPNANNGEILDSTKESREDGDFVPSDNSSASYNHNEHYHDNVRYRTESGQKIEILDGLYKKCIINDNEQAFINIKYLEPYQAKLRFQNDGSDTVEEIPIESMKQYNLRLGSNKIDLDDHVVNQLESRLNMTIVPEEVEEIREAVEIEIPRVAILRNRLVRKVARVVSTSGMFIFLILKTLYYVFITNFMIFMLLSELAFFVSLRTTGIIFGLVIARTIFVNEEVRIAWIDFFHLDRYSFKYLERIRNFVEDDNLAFEFYDSMTHITPDGNNVTTEHKSVLGKLFEYPKFHDVFINLINSNGLGNISLDLLEKMEIYYQDLTDIEREMLLKTWKELISYYILVLIDIDHQDNISNKKQFVQDMNVLVGYIEKEMYRNKTLPLKLRLVNGVKNGVRRVRDINMGRQILEYVVPNPIRDNVLLSVLKNMVLFVLLLLPLVNLEVDKIVKERKEAIERQQAKLREQNELQDLQNEHDEGINTGAELQDLQGQQDEGVSTGVELQEVQEVQDEHDEGVSSAIELTEQHDLQGQHDDDVSSAVDVQEVPEVQNLQGQHDEGVDTNVELPEVQNLQNEHDEGVRTTAEVQNQHEGASAGVDLPNQHDGVNTTVNIDHDDE